MRNEVDQHEVKIINEAEYFTAVIYRDGGAYRGEYTSAEGAMLQIDRVSIGLKRALVYAVRHPNQALVAIYTIDGWELAKFRGIDHPLSHLIKDGKLVL
jgi:hypothetical protein